jgi:hypothetical protein
MRFSDSNLLFHDGQQQLVRLFNVENIDDVRAADHLVLPEVIANTSLAMLEGTIEDGRERGALFRIGEQCITEHHTEISKSFDMGIRNYGATLSLANPNLISSFFTDCLGRPYGVLYHTHPEFSTWIRLNPGLKQRSSILNRHLTAEEVELNSWFQTSVFSIADLWSFEGSMRAVRAMLLGTANRFELLVNHKNNIPLHYYRKSQDLRRLASQQASLHERFHRSFESNGAKLIDNIEYFLERDRDLSQYYESRGYIAFRGDQSTFPVLRRIT